MREIRTGEYADELEAAAGTYVPFAVGSSVLVLDILKDHMRSDAGLDSATG